mmetsp:Transcript_6417/g.22604  ORF Transcript_6417/g.22604 Transcript_6417/m.22604 type:complete len:348 (-) Transcript_6417:4338-5381(-)
MHAGGPAARVGCAREPRSRQAPRVLAVHRRQLGAHLVARQEAAHRSLHVQRRVVVRRGVLRLPVREDRQPVRHLLPQLLLLVVRQVRVRDAARERVERLQEVDAPAVVRDVHVHDDLLDGRLAQPAAADAEGRVQLGEHELQLARGDVVRRARVQLGPHLDEADEVVAADGRVLRAVAVLEVVDDDGDDEVQHHKRAQDDKDEKVQDSDGRVRRAAVLHLVAVHAVVDRAAALVRLADVPVGAERDVVGDLDAVGERVLVNLYALRGHHAVPHDPVPALARRHAEQQHERVREVPEVGVASDEVVVVLDAAKQVHAHDRKDEEEQEQHAAHVDERRHGKHERLEQSP